MINIERLQEIIKDSHLILMSDGVLYINVECISDEYTEELFHFLLQMKDLSEKTIEQNDE